MGFVPTEDKTRLINAATLLTAAPEKKEHFGIIYAEALAGGTPPVTYTGGGVPSIVTPDASASSLSVEARPPRVGSRKQRVLGAAASVAATRWLSGAASLSMSVWNVSPSRLDTTAIP